MAGILIVDDEDQMRHMLRLVLEREGYTVWDASNGNVGIVICRQEPVDLLITDLIMPEKEGIETIVEIKRTHPDVKVIAMSGGGRTKNLDFLKIAEKVGAQRTLAKPFRPHEFLEAVREVLSAS